MVEILLYVYAGTTEGFETAKAIVSFCHVILTQDEIHSIFMPDLCYCVLVDNKSDKRINNFLPQSLPERIYNSHYGNGVPAMFTS